jgi:hypothetical protein
VTCVTHVTHVTCVTHVTRVTRVTRVTCVTRVTFKNGQLMFFCFLDCPSSHTKIGRVCYHLSSSVLPFSRAQQYCNDLGYYFGHFGEKFSVNRLVRPMLFIKLLWLSNVLGGHFWIDYQKKHANATCSNIDCANNKINFGTDQPWPDANLDTWTGNQLTGTHDDEG